MDKKNKQNGKLLSYKDKSLYNAFCAAIKNEDLFNSFFEDLLTPKEKDIVYQRWDIILMLNSGVKQRNIADNLSLGIATVTRGSRELRDKSGGFHQVLKILNK